MLKVRTLLKPINWVGSSYHQISQFPLAARQEAGFQLRRVQAGLMPGDWKPMKSVGQGVTEIRIHEPHEHRVIYVAKYPEAVYVLAGFEKKSQKTAQRHIELARRLYEQVKEQRQK